MDTSVLILVVSYLHPIDIFQTITRVNNQFHQLCSKSSELWRVVQEEDFRIEYEPSQRTYDNCVAFAKEAFQVQKVWDTLSKFYTLERNSVWIQGKEHFLPLDTIDDLQKKMDKLAAEHSEWRNKKIAYHVPLELRLFLRKTKGLEAGLQHPDEEGNDSGYNGRIPSIDYMKTGFVDEAGVNPVAQWEEGGDFYMECNKNNYGYGRIDADEDEEDEGTTMRAWLVRTAEEYFRKLQDDGDYDDCEELLEQLKALHKYCDITDTDEEATQEEEENEQENEHEEDVQQNTESEMVKKRSLAESEAQPETKRSRIESNEDTEDQEH